MAKRRVGFMDLKTDFHFNGFAIWEVQVSDELIDFVTDCVKGSPPKGFSLEEKYALSADLRPNALDAKPIKDFLESNQVERVLSEASGRELKLKTVQFRVAYPDPKPYMSWHRDVHFYSNATEPTGDVPPPVKMILYPVQRNAEPQATLRVVPRSHHRLFRNRFIDRLQTLPGITRKSEIVSSNKTALVFNTQLFHTVLAARGTPSVRIIISFV